MNSAQRESLYGTLARLSGLTLVVLCVLFQRRGLLHWSELVFLGACIGLQETFLRLNVLHKLRAPMLVIYSMLPLALVLMHAREIHAYRGDFVQIVLNTPLPLVLVSVQIMVLYVREAPRLVSVVLVLALFSTVIGVRRPIDDSVWPWLAMIGASGAIFLMVQHPGMLFHGVYVARRPGALPPTGRPGGVVRGAFFSVLPLLTLSVLAASVFLYFALPRFSPEGENGGIEVANRTGPDGPEGPTDTDSRGNPRNPRNPRNTGPATVSGLAEGVDLGDFGEIKRSTTPALNVELLSSRETVQRVYLRAFNYATFDGYSWFPLDNNAATTREVEGGTRRLLPDALRAPRRGHADRRYRITVLDAGLGSGGQLPLPVEPYMIQNYQGTVYYDSASQTARAPLASKGDVYEVAAQQLILSDGQMRDRLSGVLPDLPPQMEYLQVPDTLRAEIRRRFNQVPKPEEGQPAGTGLYDRFEIVANTDGAYATAAGIVHMFHTAKSTDGKAWVYSLDFRPEPGEDAVARFLDTNNPKDRVGHCEYFASAMCMLLRCYDIPSRVAAGFLAMNPTEEGVFEVNASAAHAWVEVWIDGFGWVTFDPTPGEEELGTGDPEDPDVAQPTPDNPDPTTDPGDPELAGGGDPTVENRDWFERYDSREQQRVFNEIGAQLEDAMSAADEFLMGLTGWLPNFMPRSGLIRALLVVMPAVTFVVLFLTARRRRKKIEAKVLEQMGEGGKKRQRSLYFQLLLLLAKYGFQKRASETPREFAERVCRKGGDQHKPILELTELYYALRFGLDESLEVDFRRALARYSYALKSASSGELKAPDSV